MDHYHTSHTTLNTVLNMSADPTRKKMKAWTCRSYGGPEVLIEEEILKPIPSLNEILIKIHATTVSSGDWRVRSMTLPWGFGILGRLIFGFYGPRQPILGTECSGVVEAIGSGVNPMNFQVGDEVVAFTGGKMGCHAQYRTVHQASPVVKKPQNIDFDTAAAISFGGSTALHYLNLAHVVAGEHVLVLGASGAVGSAIVQLAAHRGAIVTGVCSGKNADKVRSLGASTVIDYTVTDFKTRTGSDDQKYDVVMDTIGMSSLAACHLLMKEDGRFAAIAGDLSTMFTRPIGTKKILAGPSAETKENLQELIKLVECGAFKPIVGEAFAWVNMKSAHSLVDSGHKVGSAVVRVC